MYLPQEVAFVHGGLLVQPFLVERTVVGIGADGEIAHAERCKVLEEMRALAGVDAVSRQAALHDNARAADLRPLHGNAQPRVRAAPTSRSHQHIASFLVLQPLVQQVQFPCNVFGMGRVEMLRPHVDHVLHVNHLSVAQHRSAFQQQAARCLSVKVG